MGSSHIGVSSPIGCGLARVRLPCTRFVALRVAGSVGSAVEFVAPTLGGCWGATLCGAASLLTLGDCLGAAPCGSWLSISVSFLSA